MKKRNNILKIFGIAAIAGSIALFTACSNTGTTQTPLNQSPATKAVSQSLENQSISLEEAVEIALGNAGVARDDARFTKTSLDNDDLIAHYEIEFLVGSKEYDYDIAVSDGRILELEEEKEEDIPVTAKPEQTKAPAAAETNASVQTTAAQNSGYISVDEAKSIALASAEIAAADAKFEKASFDSDDLIPHYDIEFYANGFEYDYEISAKTGDIIEIGKEKERSRNQAAASSDEYINAETAKEKALSHANVNAADVNYIKAELDTDDGIAHYEIEFKAGAYEYEYKVNAVTGDIINGEKELDD